MGQIEELTIENRHNKDSNDKKGSENNIKGKYKFSGISEKLTGNK